ncbi:hypothetical protein BV898_02972 [Hypsibius exemplaris]|uniref:DRBM domain-containing protein n=1 Tax=Hypsibius exemplaris TaxID=2072580 RepID=A0A1W0X6W5_HYPEX|nr:hypothetical protein BV898_02972 [Hypsibius exemplaris]
MGILHLLICPFLWGSVENSTLPSMKMAQTAQNYVGQLNEFCQKRKYPPPKFLEVRAKRSGPSHQPVFVMSVKVSIPPGPPRSFEASGSSIQTAKSLAAQQALESLLMPPMPVEVPKQPLVEVPKQNLKANVVVVEAPVRRDSGDYGGGRSHSRPQPQSTAEIMDALKGGLAEISLKDIDSSNQSMRVPSVSVSPLVMKTKIPETTPVQLEMNKPPTPKPVADPALESLPLFHESTPLASLKALCFFLGWSEPNLVPTQMGVFVKVTADTELRSGTVENWKHLTETAYGTQEAAVVLDVCRKLYGKLVDERQANGSGDGLHVHLPPLVQTAKRGTAPTTYLPAAAPLPRTFQPAAVPLPVVFPLPRIIPLKTAAVSSPSTPPGSTPQHTKSEKARFHARIIIEAVKPGQFSNLERTLFGGAEGPFNARLALSIIGKALQFDPSYSTFSRFAHLLPAGHNGVNAGEDHLRTCKLTFKTRAPLITTGMGSTRDAADDDCAHCALRSVYILLEDLKKQL